ncbi:MAG TPA: metal ABC transporter permease [Ktedonobacteraceae bacterium]|nr:metal ABC transporter permease [Ktedonobacteraceae bacterium]
MMSTFFQYWVTLFQHEFVQNAFLAAPIVAVVTAIMGYFVVLRAQAFAGEALADIGFAGAMGAAVLGISSLVGMFIMVLLAALGMGALGKRIQGRDVEIGMVLSFALGLGVLFLSIYTQNGANATAGVGVLFGSILSVTRTDVLISLITALVTLLIIALLFRPLLFASIDPVLAQARGVPVRLLSIVFLLLLALATAEAVLVIGVLLVFSLLIAPAATAERLTHRPLTAILLSVVLGLSFSWGGLVLAFVGTGRHLPVSFYISALAALSYFFSLLVRRVQSPHGYRALPHPSREQTATV